MGYVKASVSDSGGDKTISPLKGTKVVRPFGEYIDPDFNIKIFKEFVTLKSTTYPHNVYNILDGKVIFQGTNEVFGKVVVVSHKDKLQTIYAGLDKIEPTVRVGKKLRQGYVLGKLKGSLIFQVIKDGKSVDPLSIIKLEEQK